MSALATAPGRAHEWAGPTTANTNAAAISPVTKVRLMGPPRCVPATKVVRPTGAA